MNSGVVNVLCRPGRGTSQVEKSPRLNWATQFMTVAYDGACSLNVSLRIAWISLGAFSYRKNEFLMTARVSMLLKTRTWPDTFPFSLCNKKRLANSAHEQSPISNDSVDSVLRHREVSEELKTGHCHFTKLACMFFCFS